MANMLNALHKAGLVSAQQVEDRNWAKYRTEIINRQLHQLYRVNNRARVENKILRLENEKAELSV
jgi:hypothetical protein